MRGHGPNTHPVFRGIRSEQQRMAVIIILALLVFAILMIPVETLHATTNEMNAEYPGVPDSNGYQGAFGESWLSGWSYRKSHTIGSALGAGTNYTIPLVVYSGSGTDTDNTVYLNGESRSDLDDIRFTGENGEDLLSFWLEDYIRGTSHEYFADDGKFFLSWDNYPSTYYYNGKTYVSWHGTGEEEDDTGNPYIRSYDHDSGYWSEAVKVAVNPLPDDSHGAPNLWVDADGYIHVLYGAHSSYLLQHAISNEPESVTGGFTVLDEIGTDVTYPKICYDWVTNVVHLIYRWVDQPGDHHYEWRYMNSTDNGETWSEEYTWLNVDADGGMEDGAFPYLYGPVGLDPYSRDRIHLAFNIFNETEWDDDENVYYCYLNLTDYHVYTAAGVDYGIIDSEVELNDNFMILDTDDYATTAGAVKVDSSHTPYILFGSEYNDGRGHTYFTYWNGEDWETPEQICDTHRFSAMGDMIVYDSDNITAFITDDRDMTRWSWDGEDWTKEETIKQAVDSRDLAMAFVVAPYGTKPQLELQMTFGEFVDSYDLKGYAWGSQGIVPDNEILGAVFWVRLPGNLSEDSQTIYIYYGNEDASSASNGFETFPLFDDFNRRSSATVGRNWVEDEGNGALSIEMNSLKIVQQQNEYCHIERSSPSQSTLVLRGKMKSGENTGASWYPALAIYWASYDWIKVGMNDYAGEFMTLMDINGDILSNSSGGAFSDSWYYYRIRVGITAVYVEYSTDGTTWSLLTNISRPDFWNGAPSLIIVGKGYAEDADTFPESDLDNSQSVPGSLGNHYTDDVFVRKYVTPEPVHGAWSGYESPNITQYSDSSITGFSETLPDDVMFRPDDETYSYGYVESFTDTSDWTVLAGNPLTCDGDVGRWENTGTTYKYAYTTTPSFSTMDGVYLEVRYRGNQTSLHGTMWGYRSNIFGDEMAFYTELLYLGNEGWQSEKWYLSSLDWYSPGSLECISFELNGEGSNWYFEVDYIRIGLGTGFGFQHDGSDITGVTPSDGGSVTSDGEYLSLTADSDGSRFEIAWDVTQTAAMMATTYYPFLSLNVHEEDLVDYIMVEVHNGAGWSVLQTNSTVGQSTKHWTVSAIEAYVQKLRISVSPYASIRIDYIKLYSIANFTVTQSGADTDDYLCVDSGSLKCVGDPSYFELNHDPTIMVDTAMYQIIQINGTCPLFETSCYIDSWSVWDARSIYEMNIGILTDIKMRFGAAGSIGSISFGRALTGHEPVFDQGPDCINIDDISRLYARLKDYQITLSASDEDGVSDIEYLELTLASDNRVNEYWTIRYNVNSDVFSEQTDPFDYISLNSVESTTVSSYSSIQVTFTLSINWNHPDLSDVDAKCFVVDSSFYSDTHTYEVNWDVETRLDLYSDLTLSDGFGTPDRGDINGEILATGSITYLGSNIHPPSTEIDVYVVSPDVAASPWSVTDYQSSNGAFSKIVYADEEAGEDSYQIRVVNNGHSADDTNLLHSSHTSTYIADSIRAAISLDSELSTDDTLVFNLELFYMFDDAPVSDYTVVISKNDHAWQTISSASFTDSRDETADNTYDIVSVNASLHGLTSLYSTTDFTLSGIDSNSTLGSFSIPSTEDLQSLAQFAGSILDGLGTVLLSIGTILTDNLIEAAEVLVGHLEFPTPALVAIGLVAALPVILTSDWSRRRTRKLGNRRIRTIFQERGGLEVYSMVMMGTTKDSLRLVVGGAETSYVLLEDYHGTISEHFKSLIAAGERPARLLVLYSTPLNETTKMNVFGVILPPRWGT